MKALVFQGHQIETIERDGELWIRAMQIGGALGYHRPDLVLKVYQKHAAEFTDSMTSLVSLPDLNLRNGGAGQSREVRVFTLRGAHLLGMFARTYKAAEFRRWVLDTLDALGKQDTPRHSLMVEWFNAKAAVDDQNRFASACGKGLNDHKTRKPPLVIRLAQATEKMQPSLQFN